jgi:acetoin utilization deacetylase AcuC-like enzyme
MINLFYTDKMINKSSNMEDSYSKSPIKPKLVVNAIKNGIYKNDIITREVIPLPKEDFLLAHTKKYVNDFFNGVEPLCSSNNIPWSKELAESVKFTNGSLFNAIDFAVNNENSFCFSPVSGFHHAVPNNGRGFCTFSGQVIASVKIYNEYNLSGAYIDLDGHPGNSIEDSRKYQPIINKAITFNINPKGKDSEYLQNLKDNLELVGESVLSGETHYIVWCHGADSHELDDLAGADRVTTEYWLKCSELFYMSVKKWRKMGYNVPVIATLFGGYRKDNYDFVIWLHQQDIELGNRILGNKK